MKILVIGSGGREHAIIWKLKQNNQNLDIFCAPGNAGIGQIAKTVPITATDMKGLLEFAQKEKIELTIVGMEDPLVLGLVDEFEKAGLRIFGPPKMRQLLREAKHFQKSL